MKYKSVEQLLSRPSKNDKRKKQNPAILKRRLQIVDFVLDKKIAKGLTSIKWQKMADAWTAAHKDDPMTKQELENAFTDATRTNYIQEILRKRLA